MVSEKMDWSRLNVEFLENHEEAIILSETLTKKELYDLILMFKAEQKRRYVIDFVKHPINILRHVYHLLKKVRANVLVDFGIRH